LDEAELYAAFGIPLSYRDLSLSSQIRTHVNLWLVFAPFADTKSDDVFGGLIVKVRLREAGRLQHVRRLMAPLSGSITYFLLIGLDLINGTSASAS
jgi:hypothetical protein